MHSTITSIYSAYLICLYIYQAETDFVIIRSSNEIGTTTGKPSLHFKRQELFLHFICRKKMLKLFCILIGLGAGPAIAVYYNV